MSEKKTKTFFEFKVIAGTLKGKTIKTPDLEITRPPLTRLRKSIFDFLNPYLAGSSYLDLFSGTGSYLFEAVSRGVTEANGVELEPILADAINKQAEKYKVSDKLFCFCENVFSAISRLYADGKKYDIIMLSPPQYKGMIDKALVLLKKNPIMAPECFIVCQHDSSETRDIDFSLFTILQQRKYGNTTFTILSGD